MDGRRLGLCQVQEGRLTSGCRNISTGLPDGPLGIEVAIARP